MRTKTSIHVTFHSKHPHKIGIYIYIYKMNAIFQWAVNLPGIITVSHSQQHGINNALINSQWQYTH